MRKLLTSGAVAVGMLLASCTPANRVVENPLIGAANTMTLDFPKIELSDTATVLHVDAYFRPHNCIRIDAGTYLLADGQKYMLQGSEGILPDSLFWMPDSGEASFVLKFGPLPRGTKSFDFIESDCDDCFKLYGVDLTGKKEYPRYPEGLPRALRKAPEDGPVPEPILAVGTTTVNVRLLGYRRGMVKEVAMYVNSLLNGQEEHTAAIDPESGTATLRFEQYGTAMAYVSCGPVFGMCWIAPGETLDMYIAMEAGGRAIVQRRDKECEPAPGRRLAFLVAALHDGPAACLHSDIHVQRFTGGNPAHPEYRAARNIGHGRTVLFESQGCRAAFGVDGRRMLFLTVQQRIDIHGDLLHHSPAVPQQADVHGGRPHSENRFGNGAVFGGLPQCAG